MRRMRPKLTYANVMATLAFFLALGGGAYAAIDLVGRNDIKSKHLAPDAAKGVDVKEATLEGVDADSLDGASPCGADHLTMQLGDPTTTLCTVGSFTVEATCVGTDQVVATLVVRGPPAVSSRFGTPDVQHIGTSVAAATATDLNSSSVADNGSLSRPFYALAPVANDDSLVGIAGAIANWTGGATGTCRFLFSALGHG